MKVKILLTVLLLAFVVPFFSGTPDLQAGRSGRTATSAVVGGLVGGIVGGIIGNSCRSRSHCCERYVVERPVYVEPICYYEEPAVYVVPQRRVYQEVRYYPAPRPIYQRSYVVYR